MSGVVVVVVVVVDVAVFSLEGRGGVRCLEMEMEREVLVVGVIAQGLGSWALVERERAASG